MPSNKIHDYRVTKGIPYVVGVAPSQHPELPYHVYDVGHNNESDRRVYPTVAAFANKLDADFFALTKNRLSTKPK